MSIKTRINSIIPVAIILAGMMLFACNNKRESTDKQDIDIQEETSDLTTAAWIWADSVINTMSLEEQIGSVLMPATYTKSDAATISQLKQFITDYHIGGILLLKGISTDAKSLIDTLKSQSALPLWVAIDAEWGLGMRLTDAPKFPANGAITKQATEDVMYGYGTEIARECRVLGINMVMGPVVDVVPQFHNNPIGQRSFGADPKRVSALAAAYTRALEAGGILPVAKHFPGHGSAMTDSHKEMPTVTKSLDKLEKEDLMPFKTLIDNGLSGLMVGHIYVEELDSVYRPADMSSTIITDLLREKWNFNGLVITDAVSMGGAKGYSPVDALLAGVDIVVAPENLNQAFYQISDALSDGRLPYPVLKQSCRRILFYKYLKCINTPKENIQELYSTETENIRKQLEGR